MYTKLDLYTYYDGFEFNDDFSRAIPDVTQRISLQHLNYAINVCDHWNTCFDIGGGNGRYTTALSHKFKHNYLIEVDVKPAHKKIEEKYKNIQVHNTLIEDFQTKEKADFILLADVYEHIEDIDTFVKQISSMQEEGSVTFIVTPNPMFCGPAEMSELHYTKKQYGHQKHYTKQEIAKLMQDHGYTLMVTMYESTIVRSIIKSFIFKASRFDKKYKRSIVLMPLRPIWLIVMKILLPLISFFYYHFETRNADINNSTTQSLIFKKI